MDQTLKQDVKAIIAETVERDIELLHDDAHFIEDLGVDSLMALEILTRLEKRFNISISEDELIRFTTVGQVLDLTLELTSQQA